MSHYHSFIEVLRHILAHGGYWIIFVVSVAEAVPLVGSFIPGHTIVFFAGFLARLHILNIWQVMLIASLGAICGDIIGYELGKKFGYIFLERHGHRFFIKKGHIDKAKEIMLVHTGKALLLGRFNPIARAFTPYLAGAGNVAKKKFWIYNIAGGLAWAVSSVVVGYVFGASYEVVSKYIGKFIFIAIVLSVLIIWGYRYINSRRHIFAKYHLFTLGINIASLYVFFKTLEDSFGGISRLATFDVWFNLKMVAIQTPAIVKYMFFITDLFSPLNLSLLTLALSVWLIYKKRWYHLSLFILSLGIGTFAMEFVKNLVGRIRPENALFDYGGYSFPSGHAVVSIVFFCVLFYIFHKDIAHKYVREFFGILAIAAFVLVGFTRLYLNVHWFSDVIGGFALGLFILSGLILLFRIGTSE